MMRDAGATLDAPWQGRLQLVSVPPLEYVTSEHHIDEEASRLGPFRPERGTYVLEDADIVDILTILEPGLGCLAATLDGRHVSISYAIGGPRPRTVVVWYETLPDS